jgi:hypothetical protein
MHQVCHLGNPRIVPHHSIAQNYKKSFLAATGFSREAGGRLSADRTMPRICESFPRDAVVE